MNKKNLVLGGIGVFTALILLTYGLNPHDKLIRDGDNLFKVDKVRDAYDKYRLAAILYPSSTNAHFRLYQVFYRNNDLERATQQLQIAAELSKNPNDFLEASKNLNNEINQPARLREQIAYWESVAESKKDYRDAYIQLSLLHFQLYEIEKAEEYLAKAKAIDPNNPTIHQLDDVYKQSNN